MKTLNRRTVLQLASGLTAVLATGRAPAFAQGTALHWLRWNDFVPASDQLLRKDIVPECEKALGIRLNIETINANDIQARTTSSIQSNSGPDVITALNNWPHLYVESVVDVSDIAEKLGKAQQGFYGVARSAAHDGKKWIAVPWAVGANLIAYRKSWFQEVGYDEFPDTWEEYHAAGKKLKARGRPIGQTLGHTFGDANTFSYAYLWCWGGQEVAEDGKTVMLGSKETVESVKFMTAFWKDAHDEGGLAWDDTNNNRAFLSGSIAATLNGASIYIEAKRKPDTYLTEKTTPMKDDIGHAALPKGPAGSFGYQVPSSNMLMGYSKNQAAAKEFLQWISSKEVYQRWFESQQGYTVGSTLMWEEDKLWQADPVMQPFRRAVRTSRFPGFAGPADRRAAEVLTKYIITDMYAKAVQGMAAEQAVKQAHDELVRIYV
jgi:ABC-type glycerol-3-phosphate transport system substrate-binding protein